jgi:hypothetical protein
VLSGREMEIKVRKESEEKRDKSEKTGGSGTHYNR